MINETQKRIIFDTSVYGRLIEDLELANKIGEKIPNEYVIYGNKTIRNELRDTPNDLRLWDKSIRILLLKIYDSFVRKEHHDLGCNKLVGTLSEDYFEAYKKESGSLSNQEMKNDLIIIATATIYQLDIVVSDDERSMFSNMSEMQGISEHDQKSSIFDEAIRAYEKVNKEYGMKNPVFKKYTAFKEEVSRRSSRYGI